MTQGNLIHESKCIKSKKIQDKIFEICFDTIDPSENHQGEVQRPRNKTDDVGMWRMINING